MKPIVFIALMCLMGVIAQAQPKPTIKLVQFAGVVISADSSRLLPLVSIRVKGSGRGSYTDASGFFSIVVQQSDTILFSSIGMRSVEYVIPSAMQSTKFSVVIPMQEDTIYLPETVIRPGPTPEEFNYYFVKANIPDEYFTRANNNLRDKGMRDMNYTMGMDGNENADFTQKGQAYQYYYNGQLPPQRLFDPIAWSQFFEAWKRGDYNKKK
ncbi:MAG: carboxypeptidase-like regulatory domain-containing protein [Bacteroidia bacterium]|nr:carboxypeptidase-like regulatory domain-containing protein [Bacteroidia bacterium]